MQFQKGDVVNTPHGKGKVVELEFLPHTTRYGVELEYNPFEYLPFYWESKLTLSDSAQQAA